MITTKQLKLYTAALDVAEALEAEVQTYLDLTVLRNDEDTEPDELRVAQAIHDKAKVELQASRALYRERAVRNAAAESDLQKAAIDVADSYLAVHEGRDEGARFGAAFQRYRKLNEEAGQ